MNTTRFLLLALLALFIVAPVSAQVNLGVIGGLNIANPNGKDVDGAKIDFSSRAGLGIGGVLDIGLSENVALRFEPMYLQKGAELNDPDDPEATLAFKIAYLEVPLFLKIALGASATRPYLLAGPIIGFNMSTKLGLSAPGIDVQVDADEIAKSTDFGLGFGAGLSIPAGDNSIFIEGRYALGLTDVAKAGAVEVMGSQLTIDDVNIKTRGIQFMAGVTFLLGGK